MKNFTTCFYKRYGMVPTLTSWAAHSLDITNCGLALVVAAEFPDDLHPFLPA